MYATTRCLLFGLVIVGAVQTAAGHGFSIRHDDDGILTYLDDNPADLFTHSLNEPAPGTYELSHGFFSSAGTVTVPGALQFGTNDTFRFDILGPLWYSGGGTAVQAAGGVTMEGVFNAIPTPSVRFDGSGTTEIGEDFANYMPGSGFAVPGNDTHDMQWLLEGATADGAYGFAYQIQAFRDGDENNPYDPANVVLVFHTPDFDGNALLGDAQQAIYAAAMPSSTPTPVNGVPEPATGILIGLAAALIGGWLVRRNRRRDANH